MKKYQTYATKATLAGLLLLTGLQVPLPNALGNVQAESQQLQEEVKYGEDYGYVEKADGTIRLVEYQGEKVLETYRIPETVDGKEVSELGTNLYNGLHVKELIVAGHIKYIESGTFTESRIGKLVMEETNDTKGERLVYNNTTIGEIEFKNTTKIGDSLFSGATVEKFKLPESIAEVGAYAFFGTTITGDIAINAEKPYGEGVFFMATVNGNITITNMPDKEKEYKYGEDNPYFQMFFQSVINGDIEIKNSDYVGYHLLAESKINGEVNIAGENTVVGNYLFRNANLQKVSMTGKIADITDNSFLNAEVVEPMIIEADVERIGFSYLDKENNSRGGSFINANLNGLTFKGKLGKINEGSFIRGKVGELRIEKGLDVGYSYSFNGVGLTNIQIIGDIGTINNEMVLNQNGESVNYDVAIQGNIQNYGGYNNDLGIREEGSGQGEGVFTGSRYIKIDGNVQNIGERAFANTNKNDSIIINGNVGRIGTQAFHGNEGNLKINGNVGHIMRIAFLSYTGDVTIQGDVAEIGSLNDRDEYETILTDYEGNFKVLGNIRKIHDNGMANYGSVYDLYVGGDIPYVGEEGLAYVSKIQVDGEVGEIGNRAFSFYGKEDGEIVNKVPKSIFKGVTKIGEDAFRYSKVEDDIVFPETLKEIGDNAFNDTGLTKVKLPKGLQYLGTGAFTQNSLACITIPKSITKTESDMIMQKNAKPIEVYGTESKGHKQAYINNENVTFIENSVFTNDCDKETWGVQVNEKTTTGEVLTTRYEAEPKAGVFEVEASDREGYKLQGERKKQVNITEDEPNHVIDFIYEKEKPVEPPVVEKPEEKPVEPPVVEKPEEKPTEPPVVEKPEEKPTEPPVVEKPEEKPVEPPVVEKPEEKPTEPPVVEKPEEKPTEPPVVEKPEEKPTEPPVVEKPEEKPTEPPVVEKPEEKPTEPPVVEKPEEKPVEPPLDEKPSKEKKEETSKRSVVAEVEKEETLPKTGTGAEPTGLYGLLLGLLGLMYIRKK